MMELLNGQLMSTNLADQIVSYIDQYEIPADLGLTCHDWLKNSEPKQVVFAKLYLDLLENIERKSVFDVGGGLTGVTRNLATQHHYILSELFAHENSDQIARMTEAVGSSFVLEGDWFDSTPEQPIDIVIANDIFPNVDQRLELFLSKFLPICREIRLSITFYDQPRFYRTKRVDAEETLFILAWDHNNCSRAFSKYADRIVGYDASLWHATTPSLYANGRQIMLIKLKGDLD